MIFLSEIYGRMVSISYSLLQKGESVIIVLRNLFMVPWKKHCLYDIGVIYKYKQVVPNLLNTNIRTT